MPSPSIDTIRSQGRRLTRQRLLVLDILKESRDHLDAETIYHLAKARDARISLPTVYRTLALLKETGLVQEHTLGEDHRHFETPPDIPHYHFTCQQCGRVIEFEAPQVSEVVQMLCQSQGLQVTSIHLLLSGKCDRCREPGTTCNND